MVSKRIFQLVSVGILAFPLAFLGGCQGTDWGNSLQSAISPLQTADNASGSSNQANTQANLSSNLPVSPALSSLPASFPTSIPIYGNVKLTGVAVNQLLDSGALTWSSADSSDRILNFYQEALSKQDWQIDSVSGANPQVAKIKASKGNQVLQLAVRTNTSYQTEIFLLYQPTPDLALSPKLENPKTEPQSASNAFTDLETAPESLRLYLQDLSQLGVISTANQNLFLPNHLVSRRELARWLFAANNQIYSDRLPRQIRPAQPSDRPSFSDIPSQDPDFAAIQGLVNAGLLRASDLKTGNRFQPEATISREEALAWKVPFDVRQLGTGATVINVRQAWGFGDSDRLTPRGLQVVLVDAQLGDLSNIRRAFGFTKILQPQKPITRAEAAAMLWRYGDQSDGNSAQAALVQKESQKELKQQSTKLPEKITPESTSEVTKK